MSDVPPSDGAFDRESVLLAFEDWPGFLCALRGEELRIVAANRGARALMHGRPLLGLRLEDVTDAGLREAAALAREVYRTQVPYHSDQFPVEIDGPDGPTSHWLGVTMSPWVDATGALVGVVGTGVDITEHVLALRRAERGAAAAHERYARAREVVARLQGALLPGSVPLLPRVEVAAQYVVAGVEQAAGGDWFDSATLPDGRLGLTVGDVVGHGVEASAIMSRLGAVLAARLLEGADVVEALGAVEAYAGRVEGAFASTVCVALLDPRTGEVEYVTRGHPAPVVVGPRGARILPTTGGGPLGARAGTGALTARLEEDEAIVLFTDGLVERPDRPLAVGLAQLQQSLVDAYRGAHGTMARTGCVALRMSRDLPAALMDGGFTDDVTVLVAARRPAPAPLELVVPADAHRLADVRAAVGDWCSAIGVGAADRGNLVLGVSEVVANSVEHAYRDGPLGPVTVRASIRDDAMIELVVRDQGRWREPDAGPAERGRGLSMIASAGLEIMLEPGADGTTVTLECPARRPAPIETSAPADGDPSRAYPRVELRADADRHHLLHISGAVDHRTAAAHVEAEVLRLSRRGLVPLTIDLTDVAHLGSAGVRVLESLLLTLDGLDVVAPAGSPAAQALAVAGTPFEQRAR